ncbi:MAG: hypothetical protein KatS3mg010_0402 [Acidimicrobiia bacterium]|nr:MAG: hypothetical protein KatS3mg010_0402 [Acidimicrobiia bacterium]
MPEATWAERAVRRSRRRRRIVGAVAVGCVLFGVALLVAGDRDERAGGPAGTAHRR